MKLAFTVANGIHYINAGGEVERQTYLMDVPDELLPPFIRELFQDRDDETKERNRWYESISISIVEE